MFSSYEFLGIFAIFVIFLIKCDGNAIALNETVENEYFKQQFTLSSSYRIAFRLVRTFIRRNTIVTSYTGELVSYKGLLPSDRGIYVVLHYQQLNIIDTKKN